MKQVDVKRKPDRSHLITVWLLIISILLVGACVTAVFMVKKHTDKKNESIKTPEITDISQEGEEVVTYSNAPVAYFVSKYYTSTPVGKYTEYYDPDNENAPYNAELEGFVSNLRSSGYVIKTLNLKECEEIPEDCALLIINNPTVDFDYDTSKLDDFYYVSDLEKLDEYMMRKGTSIIVNNDDNVSLPRLDEFCSANGIAYGDKPILVNTNTLFVTNVTEIPTSIYQVAPVGEMHLVSSAFEVNLNTTNTTKHNVATLDGSALIFIILIMLAPVVALPLGIIIIIKRKFSQGGES